MKKFWKIFGITIGSVLGVALIAVLVAVYLVFTPQRLTPIVRNLVSDYVSCDHTVGNVDLTFFSTFPEFGVRIGGFYVVNPMEGAQSDTVLAAPEAIARVDVNKYLKENTLEVYELVLKEASVNIFINEEGKCNLDVFVLPQDTTPDTTKFSLPFDILKVKELSLDAPTLTFVDKKDSIQALLSNTTLQASADGLEDINLDLIAENVSATVGKINYADSVRLQLKSDHTGFCLDSLRFTLRDAKLQLNEFEATVDGMFALKDEIRVDAKLTTDFWDIPSALKLVPKDFTSWMDYIDIDAATAKVIADVRGVYNDSTMPLIDANVILHNGKAAYMEVFPYRITDINLNAFAHIDLNKETQKQSTVTVNSLHARTGKTTLDAEGNVYEILDDILADMKIRVDANLPEFKRYLESDSINTDMQGRAKGKVNAKIRLSALEKLEFGKGDIAADLDISAFHLTYDSILVDADQMNLAFNIPNKKPARKQVGWINGTLTAPAIKVEMIDYLQADLDAPTLHLQSSDILSSSNMLYANIILHSPHLNAELDSMGATLKQPELSAAVDYNMKDSKQMPVVDATLNADDINGYYTDTKAQLGKSTLTAVLSPSSHDRSQPKLHATLETASLNATVGDDVKVSTEKLSASADAERNPKKENLLLQWNPSLKIDLVDGEAELASFSEKINIPQITFDYSNKVFNISKSNIILGNSDFSLTGEIRNIGAWLDKEDKLWGELTFTSDHTDVNEIMSLTTADSGSEETKEEAEAAITPEDKEAHPFLVPTDVDLTLVTKVREAVVFDQLARELGGKLYVKDGVLVIEEMGFICNAAQLQLTAIYKTPRRNHIYAGLDYHMVDINMQELVNMIPQIDTMMPMLRSFRGEGEFHLAAETYLNANYDPKWSTARGAVSITGKNLVLLDSETFGKIAKILMFSKKTENLVDSISVQATLFKKEIDIYPFCMSIDNYMAAAGGRHNLDMTFDYHISLLKPLYIGVNVSGNFDDLDIKLAKCKYAQDFRPIIRRDVETQNASLKKMINAALKRNVQIQSTQSEN